MEETGEPLYSSDKCKGGKDATVLASHNKIQQNRSYNLELTKKIKHNTTIATTWKQPQLGQDNTSRRTTN